MHTSDSTPAEVLASRLEGARSHVDAAEHYAKIGRWPDALHALDKSGCRLVLAADQIALLEAEEEALAAPPLSRAGWRGRYGRFLLRRSGSVPGEPTAG